MQIDLNKKNKRIVTDLKQKSILIHTCKSSFSTTRDAHYKEKVLPAGEFLHDTIKDAAQCISYTPIKPKNIMNMKYALGFCHECTKYIITDE